MYPDRGVLLRLEALGHENYAIPRLHISGWDGIDSRVYHCRGHADRIRDRTADGDLGVDTTLDRLP